MKRYPPHFYDLLKAKLPIHVHYNDWREAFTVKENILEFLESVHENTIYVEVIPKVPVSAGSTLVISRDGVSDDPLRKALIAAGEATDALTTPPVIVDEKK